MGSKHGQDDDPMEFLSKNIMIIGVKVVNDVVISGMNIGRTHFEDLYIDEVIFHVNKCGSFHLNYPRSSENQCQNRECDDGQRDHNWECVTMELVRKTYWVKDRYVPSHEQ